MPLRSFRSRSRLAACFGGVIAGLGGSAHALDQNGNGLNDIWEMVHGASALSAVADADGDGVLNAAESDAGTDPFDPQSRPVLIAAAGNPGWLSLSWPRVAGKRYRIESRTDLTAAWATEMTETAANAVVTPRSFGMVGATKFFRLAINDVDTDADGLFDAEERWLGFDPATNRSDRSDTADLARVTAGLSAASTVTVGVLDDQLSERWPDPGVFVVRRTGGLARLTVNVTFAGTATRGSDYEANVPGTTVSIPAGAREVPVEISPIADGAEGEATESIILSVTAGTGYQLGATTSGTISLINEPANAGPSAKSAARFLLQAAFGPDQDEAGDTDQIPENVETVMATGFNGWINDQFTRPLGYIQPWVDWADVNGSDLELYGNWKENSWWNRAMGVAKLRPDDAGNVTPDPLRQRVAFALSEILVVSDRPEQLGPDQRGMANYYDLMVKHAFGNYRDLLYDVALHPAMGIYLSHVGNQKANPAQKIYPDENFARELMQLFTIGLWELEANGERKLANGQPIPTYDNDDITELARVFTGLSFGNNTNFQLHPRSLLVPMKMWDAFHDCGAKTLLGGLALPARTESAGNAGTAGLADVNAAIDNLFQHANTGPFVCKQLIQRLVTSNPSPAYVGRVAAAFANNGNNVRGDMKAVIKAILLDEEARDPQRMSLPTWGKLREPFLRCVNLARAFNASSASGWYPLDQFALDHLQDPMNAPSVFNFFLPAHSPPGPITAQGLVAPEFQILNASTAITGPNYFWQSILGDLHRWGSGNANYAVRLNLVPELSMIVPAAQINQDTPAGPALDPDPLLRRLDLVLTGGTLSARQFQIIREAMQRVPVGGWHWHRERLRLAIYLIVTSSDFNVQR